MPTSASTYKLTLVVNSALWLTMASIIVRSCGAVREIVFAGSFGVSQETDAFFLAFTYTTFVPSVLASALSTTLVTRLAAESRQDRLSMGSLREPAKGVLLLSSGSALLAYAAAPFVLSGLFNLSGEDLERTIAFSRILTPLAVTMVMAASLDAVLNSAKRFFIPGITSAATPLTMIMAIVFLGARWGIDAAAWGMVAGGIAEVLILTFTIHVQRQTLFGRQRFLPDTSKDRAFWRGVSILACSAMIAAVSPVVDQMFLARLDTGAITTFNYASKVDSLLIGVFGTAFSVAIYPYLTDLAAHRQMAALKHLSLRICALIVPLSLLASTIVFLFSFEIVQLLFARGRFTEADTLAVAHIQRIFAFHLVFYTAGLVAVRVLNAVGAAKFIFWLSCIGVVLNATFDWLFYQHLGAGGIALSSVLTSVGTLIAAGLFIRAAFAHAKNV